MSSRVVRREEAQPRDCKHGRLADGAPLAAGADLQPRGHLLKPGPRTRASHDFELCDLHWSYLKSRPATCKPTRLLLPAPCFLRHVRSRFAEQGAAIAMSSAAVPPRRRRPPLPPSARRRAAATYAAASAMALLLLIVVSTRSLHGELPLQHGASGLPDQMPAAAGKALRAANSSTGAGAAVAATPLGAAGQLQVLMIGHDLTLTGAPLAMLEIATHLRDRGHSVRCAPLAAKRGQPRRSVPASPTLRPPAPPLLLQLPVPARRPAGAHPGARGLQLLLRARRAGAGATGVAAPVDGAAGAGAWEPDHRCLPVLNAGGPAAAQRACGPRLL